MKRSMTVAIVCFVAACAANEAKGPDPAELRKQLARSLMRYREWSSASKPLRELVALRPNDTEARTMLAHSYREQGLYAQAEEEYRAAIARNANEAEAFGGLGILVELRGDPGDESLTYFRRAIALQPENAAFHNNLGFALYLRGRYEEAEQELQEALRHEPSARRVRNNLGFIFACRGDLHRAQREFQHGGARAVAENNLGLALERAGMRESACESYRAAERLDPHLESAAQNAERTCNGRSPGGQP